MRKELEGKNAPKPLVGPMVSANREETAALQLCLNRRKCTPRRAKGKWEA